MVTLTQEPVKAKIVERTSADLLEPRPAPDWPLRRFSLDEYHRLIDIGFFQPEERLELIKGTLRDMSPISPRHAQVIRRLTKLFVPCLADNAEVSIQSPITLMDQTSEPEPDFAIVSSIPEEYADRHPGAADLLLVVEVSLTTLTYDRTVKIPLYAAAGIAEYWIVNLIDDVIEIYRQPTVLASGAAGYAEKSVHAGDDPIAPAAFPDCPVAVNAIIPGAN